MQYKYFVGADISKATIDISVLSGNGLLFYKKIDNTRSAIKSWLKEAKTEFKIGNKSTIFCIEHTGRYGEQFCNCVSSNMSSLWVESGLRIKKSLGIQRGKNDKIDSLRIAQYALDHFQNAILWQRPRNVLNLLKHLWSIRTALQLTISKLEVRTTEIKPLISKTNFKKISGCYSHSLKALKQDFADVEHKVHEVINQDERLSHLYAIATSVPGVGFVVAVEMIICTNEFLNFNSPKKFACYCGIAPFEYRSGTSVHGKTKVSYIANIRMKTALHFPSLSVIQVKGEMRDYYQRKISEGHPKMSVLNAIKNKIVHRVFACIKEDRLYKKEYQFTTAEDTANC